MANALISGAAGFLGQAFSRKFLQLGYQVTGIDNLDPVCGNQMPQISHAHYRFLKADCVDFFRSQHNHYEVVLHLAGIVGGRKMIENSRLLLTRNLIIDTELFLWAERTRPQYLILFSSSAVYPTRLQTQDRGVRLREIDFDCENLSGNPDQTYGWGKQNLEYLAKVYWQTTKGHCVVYRPFSGYGPGQSGQYPIPSICTKALQARSGESLEIWGSGLQSRDFIYIEDLVDAVVQTYRVLNEAVAVNLCTGRRTSFLQVAEMLLKALKKECRIVSLEQMPAGVFNRVGDPSLIRELGFEPKFTLEEGLKQVLSYLERSSNSRRGGA